LKAYIKKLIKNILGLILSASYKSRIGTFLSKQILGSAMQKNHTVSYNGVSMSFVVPNSLCEWRVKTFSTKEPETLEWIDMLPEGAIVWDIGANIGLYSIYGAMKRNCEIWAFEPSVFNLELLARNIFVNNLTHKIKIVPLALNDISGLNKMKMTTTEWGGAMSTFGKDFGWDGNTIKQVFIYTTLGVSMEDAVSKLSIPHPEYIKMDVDGLEHIILKGGLNILKKARGILIEVNDEFHDHAMQCSELLIRAGMVLKEKRHSDMMECSTTGFKNTFNQIWIRP
jgi:FkbM family methyltransferase